MMSGNPSFPESLSFDFKARMTKQCSRFSKYSVEDIKELYTRKPLSEAFEERATTYIESKQGQGI